MADFDCNRVLALFGFVQNCAELYAELCNLKERSNTLHLVTEPWLIRPERPVAGPGTHRNEPGA